MNRPWETEEYYRKRAEARKRFPIPIKTNADRIRQMSDEELAEWIADHPVISKYDGNNPEHKKWLDWLKSPYTDFIENKIIKKENTND